MTYMEQRLVIAGLHIDLWLRLDAVVHDERQCLTVTEGRNSPCEQSGNNGSISVSSAISTLSPSWSLKSERRR
jgi:hypothetical protein